MRRKIAAFLLLAVTAVLLCACSNPRGNSYFHIYFIDVGQGDAALIECDGRFMLLDGGDTSAEDEVYCFLRQKEVQHLDILAVSHLHKDHYGGLTKALTYASSVDLTICNSDASAKEEFGKFQTQLNRIGAKITLPATGDEYELGSAVIEVIDASAEEENDSLVLLITYGDTRFLFTGDIGNRAQTRIADKYQNEADEPFSIDLMKMPHHGAYTGALYRFLRTFMPKYAVISVGAGNSYRHPDQRTLDLLDNKTWKPTVFRTDHDGTITVMSDGTDLKIETTN